MLESHKSRRCFAVPGGRLEENGRPFDPQMGDLPLKSQHFCPPSALRLRSGMSFYGSLPGGPLPGSFPPNRQGFCGVPGFLCLSLCVRPLFSLYQRWDQVPQGWAQPPQIAQRCPQGRARPPKAREHAPKAGDHPPKARARPPQSRGTAAHSLRRCAHGMRSKAHGWGPPPQALRGWSSRGQTQGASIRLPSHNSLPISFFDSLSCEMCPLFSPGHLSPCETSAENLP